MNFPDFHEFQSLKEEQILPYYHSLQERSLSEKSLETWMDDWSTLRKLVDETYARLQLAYQLDTTDEKAERRYLEFLADVYPGLEEADQQLKEKLLSSGFQPEGMELPLKKMALEADLFREENLPLLTEEQKLGSQYSKIMGAQTVEWQGEELTLAQIKRAMQTPDRGVRERIWEQLSRRQLADEEGINQLWEQLMAVRKQLAENAGKQDFREYSWQKRLRMAYTPEDSLTFLKAVRQVVVPAATRVYQRYAARIGIEQLRPWDLLDNQTPFLLPPIEVFETEAEFISRAAKIFKLLDPQLGKYFRIMEEEDLLDLMSRKGKGPGAFCTSFATEGIPFIFMNAVGLSSDIRVLFHESGHAFHVFERSQLPYHHQWRAGMEFNEVASTAMELLASSYLEKDAGGFLSPRDAARSRIQHLEGKLVFWPYMAVVVAFQHWVYQHHAQASAPEACSRKWSELVDLYMPGIDWSGHDQVKATGWQRKLHIHRAPFYYIEYGLSQLGAVQIWENAQQDLQEALRSYRHALALGGTADLPALYQTSGAKFAFDVDTLEPAVRLIEETLADLESKR
jgi:oligoendopeptidase F